MDNLELTHWGIKGMKWGVRRYQNRDGTLTAAGKKRYIESGDDDSNETTEQKREKLLKSTNPNELYKNRNLLTTAEINERLNRIDTERRLGQVAESTKKSGMDKVDQLLKVGRKMNEVYEFTNTPMMKEVKKQLGLEKEKPKTKTNLDGILDKIKDMSDDDVATALKRARNTDALTNLLNPNSKGSDSSVKDMQKQIEDILTQLDELKNK